jgi:alkylation response protein AidB-like acyl-CoA dehydrogenase
MIGPTGVHDASIAPSQSIRSRVALSLTKFLFRLRVQPVRNGRAETTDSGEIVDFAFPPETEHLRRELRAWLHENLTDEVIDSGRKRGRDEQAFEQLRAWSATMADAGWAAISWPAEYGGRDATAFEQLVYAEETTRARVPLSVNVIALNNIAPAIMQYGTENQKKRLLPRMLRADDIWCQGMSEPDAGSDLASLRTRAVRADDSADAPYVVSGQKIWTSLGHRADWCQLYVRTDPEAPKHRGISCLIVDMSSPGITVRPLVTLNGDADFAEVFFDDVEVPADALLGPLHGGWQVATATLSFERAAAARLYSELQVRLDDLVRDVVADGADVTADPAVLGRLGELDVAIKNLEILCQRSISDTVNGKDGFATASLAKSVWGHVGQQLAALAFDVVPPDRRAAWDDFRLTSHALTIAGGTTNISKNITGQRVLGLPRG